MDYFQNAFDEVISKYLEEIKDDVEKQTKLMDNIENVTKDTIKKSAEGVYRNLKEDSHRMFLEETFMDNEFTSRLNQRWYSSFVLLKSIIKSAEEVSMDLIEEFYEQQEKNEKHNFIMNVLFKLHSRSVQISKEVLVLLKNGFPDGALARWRSLHENNVIFQILTKNFEDIDFTFDLTKRFMDYSEIERQKEAIKYQNAAPKLGLDIFDVNELQEYEKRKKDILSLYGNDFEKPNFWAKPIFKYEPKVIYFSHLEREAQLDTLNPYYNQSNYQVHTSPKGIFQSIGFIEDFNQQTFYLYGGSNYGLSIPGQLTAISLFQTTTQFLTLNPNIDTLVIAEAISMMVDDCIEGFHNIQDEIEKEEADKSNK